MATSTLTSWSDIFMPWESELFVRIEGRDVMRSNPVPGNTLFDHILDVYMNSLKTLGWSNLDDWVDAIEIKEFRPVEKYIHIRMNDGPEAQHTILPQWQTRESRSRNAP